MAPVRISRSAVAFAIDRNRLITSADVAGSFDHVHLEDSQGSVLEAKVIAHDQTLALLEVSESAMGGRSFQYLNIANSFSGGRVRCVAIPEASVFGPQVVLVPGENVPAPPASGRWNVGLSENPRLQGSPLIDEKNEVVGIALPQRDDLRTRIAAIGFREVQAFLARNNSIPAARSGGPDIMGIYEVSAGD